MPNLVPPPGSTDEQTCPGHSERARKKLVVPQRSVVFVSHATTGSAPNKTALLARFCVRFDLVLGKIVPTSSVTADSTIFTSVYTFGGTHALPGELNVLQKSLMVDWGERFIHASPRLGEVLTTKYRIPYRLS
jgi:hypothetical protein